MSDQVDNFLQETLKPRQESSYLKCIKIFQHSDELKGMFKFNIMTDNVEFNGQVPWDDDVKKGSGIRDYDIIALKTFLNRNYSLNPTKETILDAIIEIGRRYKYHPIKDYLNELNWDGTPRLSAWLHAVVGCEDTGYTQAVSRKTLIAAVARVYEPGVKFDNLTILEGTQNIGKGLLVKAIAGDKKYYAPINFHKTDKDIVDIMQGKWILEVEEMEGFGRGDVERIKALLSRETDRCRLSYGRLAQDFNRTSIMIGTYNPDGENRYLSDPTGNRRFWPIECKGEINIELFKEERDQLFAEAKRAYQNKEALWLEDVAVYKLATAKQVERHSEDPWADIIHDWLNDQEVKGTDYVTVIQIAIDCLHIPKERINRSTTSRIGRIMIKTTWQRTVEKSLRRKLFYIPPKASKYDPKYTTIDIDWADDVQG